GERAKALADIAQRNARRPAPFRPHIGAAALPAERERPLRDAELRVDFERARLHSHRPRLLRGPRMVVYDCRAHTAPSELIGEHQPGRLCSHDQYISVHMYPFQGFAGSSVMRAGTKLRDSLYS